MGAGDRVGLGTALLGEAIGAGADVNAVAASIRTVVGNGGACTVAVGGGLALAQPLTRRRRAPMEAAVTG